MRLEKAEREPAAQKNRNYNELQFQSGHGTQDIADAGRGQTDPARRSLNNQNIKNAPEHSSESYDNLPKSTSKLPP